MAGAGVCEVSLAPSSDVLLSNIEVRNPAPSFELDADEDPIRLPKMVPSPLKVPGARGVISFSGLNLSILSALSSLSIA